VSAASVSLLNSRMNGAASLGSLRTVVRSADNKIGVIHGHIH